MLTILFAVLFFTIFGKIIIFAIKASWGILKVLMYIIFLPAILIGLVLAGLVYIALPILLIIGIVSMVAS